jgi:hypothetical protein
MRYLTIILGFAVIVMVIIAGCSTTQKSIIEKKTDLNIGDTAVLTSNGNSISIKVINFSQPSIPSSPSKGFYNPGTAPTTPPAYGSPYYAIGYELKNVGDKAITGTESYKYWVTDWAKVNHDTALRDPICGSAYRCIDSEDPLYPGDSVTRVKYYSFSDKSLEGKLTFYYQFGDDTASWIVKS